jgi:hypothetical protein
MPGLCSVAIRNYPLMHLGSKTWEPDVVFHENDIVTFCGSSYQAIKDTMRVPITHDWRCIAARGNDGRDFNVCGTFDPTASYRVLDIVTLDHGWFIAKRDNPVRVPAPAGSLVRLGNEDLKVFPASADHVALPVSPDARRRICAGRAPRRS